MTVSIELKITKTEAANPVADVAIIAGILMIPAGTNSIALTDGVTTTTFPNALLEDVQTTIRLVDGSGTMQLGVGGQAVAAVASTDLSGTLDVLTDSDEFLVRDLEVYNIKQNAAWMGTVIVVNDDSISSNLVILDDTVHTNVVINDGVTLPILENKWHPNQTGWVDFQAPEGMVVQSVQYVLPAGWTQLDTRSDVTVTTTTGAQFPRTHSVSLSTTHTGRHHIITAIFTYTSGGNTFTFPRSVRVRVGTI